MARLCRGRGVGASIGRDAALATLPADRANGTSGSVRGSSFTGWKGNEVSGLTILIGVVRGVGGR
jgi:hypothetical protein